MYDISIIVPVYKAEDFLDRCVQSILAQTMSDFELILIDDGSPDRCGEMCDAYAKQDSRIKVLHQENAGQAVARNRALDIVQGKYIGFVDSDDYIHPQAFEILLSNAKKHEAKISVCGYQAVQGLIEHSTISEVPSKKWQGQEFLRHCLIDGVDKKPWVLWDKIFHRDCFRNTRFPAGRIYEDNAVVYRMLYEAETIADCDEPLYYYFYNENSTVNQNFRLKHLDWLKVPEEMIPYFEEKQDALLVDKLNRSYLFALADLYQKVKTHLDEPVALAELKEKLKKQYRSEKQRYPITIKTHPNVMEILRPLYSRFYWTWQGALSHLKHSS